MGLTRLAFSWVFLNFWLILNKCEMVSLYGLEASSLNASDIWSLDFVINQFFMKLFKTNDTEIVKYCQDIFGFELPSVRLSRLKKRFLASYNMVDNSICRHYTNIDWCRGQRWKIMPRSCGMLAKGPRVTLHNWGA